MRKIVYVILLAALGWAGYWFVGSRAMEGALRTWLADRQQAGWVAEYDQLNTIGFPNRFDTTIQALELADPSTGVAWSVPRLEILQLSYKPNHIILRLPGEQSVASPYQRIAVTSSDLRGSIVFDPDTDLTLNRATFAMADMALSSTLGWTARLNSGQFATRQARSDRVHDIYFEAKGLTPSDGLRDQLDPTNSLPASFSIFKAQAKLGFTDPWDRHAIETARPQIETLDLDLVQAKWGDLDLRIAGNLTVDTRGIPTGDITVKAANWRDMLAIAEASGAVPAGFVPTLRKALEFVSKLSGDPRTLDAPLTFRNGIISFGPIPLGQAPRLIIR